MKDFSHDRTRSIVTPCYGGLYIRRVAISESSLLDWSDCSAVERDLERVSGAWLFRETRVPVAALFQNLEDGVSLGQFVELFPGVTAEQARQVLQHAAASTTVALA